MQYWRHRRQLTEQELLEFAKNLAEFYRSRANDIELLLSCNQVQAIAQLLESDEEIAIREE
jgi:hypothetical protein